MLHLGSKRNSNGNSYKHCLSLSEAIQLNSIMLGKQKTYLSYPHCKDQRTVVAVLLLLSHKRTREEGTLRGMDLT